MIKCSVGRGGMNKPTDVKFVQQLLNQYLNCQRVIYFQKLAEDGNCGAKTIEAIKTFQSHVVALAWPDCRIDAGGETIRKLQQYDNSNKQQEDYLLKPLYQLLLYFRPTIQAQQHKNNL